MAIPKPNLDDRTFVQLVDDARKLIPRYAPQWTDHNLSDPGITLIDLFAWLTEITLYRINLITDSHRLKYLKLLGIRPEPAEPSKVELTFESAAKIKNGDVVYTEISNKKVFFEIDDDITTGLLEISPVSLKKVIVDELTGGVFDRTDSNEKADLYYAPFGMNVKKGCKLYLGFISATAPASLSFMCYLYEKDLKNPGRHGDEQDYQVRKAGLIWQVYGSSGWVNIMPEFDGTDGFKKSGKLLFGAPGDWKPASVTTITRWGDEISTEYYWLRCVVEEPAYEYPPRIDAIRASTVSATHGLTITDDNEPRLSSGLPHQVFALREKHVLGRTMVVSVDEPDGETKWQEVDDFDSSGHEDNHFVLDKENGKIMFGDGIMGRIPPDGASIKVIKYRTGGGKEGNIAAGCVWKIAGQENLKIVNYENAAGGTDAEAIDEAVRGFLKDLKIPYTAVTSEDFEHIAVNTPGLRVARAAAIANYYKGKNNEKGSVTVAVIPDTHLDKPPELLEDFRMAICHHLDKHRLIGTNIDIISPLYVKVDVNATIAPVSGFTEETLKTKIRDKLGRFLHPIRGGRDGSGWEIGENVYLSEIYDLIEKIEGVNCVVRLSLSGDNGSDNDDYGNLILPPRPATIYSGSHTVTIAKERDNCARENSSKCRRGRKENGTN